MTVKSFLSIISLAVSLGAADANRMTPSGQGEIQRFVQRIAATPAADQDIAREINQVMDVALAFAEIGSNPSLQQLRAARVEIAVGALRASRGALGRLFQNRRINKQFGESAAGGGTTSLASKTSVAELISAAFETGALARDRQGSVTTFRVNAFGIYSIFPNRERPCSITDPSCDTSGELGLRGLSASLSIDNNAPQAAVQPATGGTTSAATPTFGLLPKGGRISSAGVRYDFLRRITPKEKGAATLERRGTLLDSVTSREGKV